MVAPFDRQIYGAEQITHVEPIVEPQIQNMAKAGRRTPTTPDDEGVERDVEGGAAIVPASLKGLDDDTVLIVTSFLPECRDVLSLSVTRVLPETAWRAAHKSLLPGEITRFQTHGLVGTGPFMAPEIFAAVGASEAYKEPIDIWAAGIQMFNMFSGKYPF